MHGAILALLASIIGPFGGFLASAIKRAYAVKDFAGVIPGHGGITDRMDCQLQVCWKETYYLIADLTVDMGLADGAWRMHALSHRAAPPSTRISALTIDVFDHVGVLLYLCACAPWHAYQAAGIGYDPQ